MSFKVGALLILSLLFTSCSKTDNHDTNDTTPAQEQSALQAPVVENAPVSTTMSSVTVTVRTLPNCEVYLGEEMVATSDSEGIALVVLPLLQEADNTFELKIKSEGRFSESVSVTIQRISEEDSVSSASQSNTQSSSNSAGVSSESVHVSSASSSSAAVVVVTTSSSAAVASQGYHVSSSASTTSTAASSSEASSSVSSQSSSALASSSSSAVEATPAFELLSPKNHVEYAYVTLEINATDTQTLTAVNTTLSSEQNRTLRINGVKNGALYYLYNLPLLQGNNDINLTAVNGAKTVSSIITLTSDANGSAPIAMRAEAHEGVQSLSTPVQTATLLDASQYLFDTDGDGVIDTTKNDDNITINLTKEGRYRPRVTIRTAKNVLYSSNDFTLSLDVKADAAQKDPAGAQPVDVAKEFVKALIDNDRSIIERLLGYNQKFINYIYSDPVRLAGAMNYYKHIVTWEQVYHNSSYATVTINIDVGTSQIDGGFEMVLADQQIRTGRYWLIRTFY